MWNRSVSWLRSAPIDDPIDRRNAPVMQALFLFLGITTPLVWAFQVIAFPMPRGGFVSMGTSAITTLAAWVGVTLIRKGRFRAAIVTYLAALLLSLQVVHLALGYRLLMMDQLDQFLLLIISALVLGRRALWWSWAALIVIALSGCIVDAIAAARAGESIAFAFSNFPSIALTYLIVAVILDRTATALRESLDEARRRSRELQHEMAERERAQSQLIHAQKMEATGRLASGVAHDFRNILDVILGFAHQRHSSEDLASDRAQASALMASLEGTETAAKRGLAITRKLLGFSRNDLLKVEVFDARLDLLELAPMLRQLFPPGIRLEMDCGEHPVPVRLDRSEFELMMLNIAANARDAMPDGGRFTVALSSQGDSALISLRDTGHGMEQRVRERIFEPFFSTKPATQGTGLGLSVIHDLVAIAGGGIEVRSAPGEGTEFRILLPLALAASP